jgi:hypothetical protein
MAKCKKINRNVTSLEKSRDSELENGISYTTVEEQWESHSTLKVDKVNIFSKVGLQLMFCYTYNTRELSSLSTPIQNRSHPLKP